MIPLLDRLATRRCFPMDSQKQCTVLENTLYKKVIKMGKIGLIILLSIFFLEIGIFSGYLISALMVQYLVDFIYLGGDAYETLTSIGCIIGGFHGIVLSLLIGRKITSTKNTPHKH